MQTDDGYARVEGGRMAGLGTLLSVQQSAELPISPTRPGGSDRATMLQDVLSHAATSIFIHVSDVR